LTQVLLVSMPGVPIAHLLGIASMLRRADIRTEVFFGDPETRLSDQLSLANSRQIPIAVIVGPDEFQSGCASVKDLRAGLSIRAGIEDREAFRRAGRAAQMTVQLGEVVATARSLLA
jgi:histidyl-tRNA synthetase